MQPNPMRKLSPRELQALQLACDGNKAKMIGHKMGITLDSANHCLERARFKLNAGNMAQLVAISFRQGIVK